jgi:phospholipid/cholesterol/gamma-HCH transport system substrate-binding protein
MKISKVMLVKVLIFAFIAALMTVALGVKLANSRLFADTYTLKAEFEDATGVLNNDAVKLAGVDVGRVAGTEIEDGKAIIEFNLDKDIKLSSDSVVGIRWRNVLGQRFLYVYPGDGDDYYREGETIPVEQTEDVSDIGEFLNRAGPVLQAIDAEDANAFLDAVNTALSGNEQDVRQLIDQGAELATTLAGEDEEIKDLLTSADTIMAAFASQDDAIGSIFDDLDEVGTVLARRTDDINSLVTDFADVQEQLDGLVTRSGDNIDATLSNLNSVASILEKDRGKLEETLDTMPLGTISYAQTSSWGEFFNVRIVELQVQDQNSEILVQQKEADNQHGDEGGSPDSGDGAEGGYEEDEDGDDSDPKDRGAREGIEAVLRFVLMGDDR